MMKVLHYIPTLGRQDGGTSMYMHQLSAELGQLVELHVVSHPVENELELEHATRHALLLSPNFWKVRRAYLQILDEVRPDVVHVNCCWHPYFAYAVIWARQAGYKVVLTPHGMLEPWIMKRHYWTRKLPSLLLFQRRAVRMATLLHATAEMERKHLLDLGWNREVCIVPNGIEVQKIAMKEDWTPSHRLLFMSRIHPKKGVDLLIRAFASLPKEYRLQIAGEGTPDYVAELKQLAQRLGLEERVEWLGGVYGAEKWRLMREADVMVLPTHSENFGIVVAEALASGTPVITTQGTPWQELESEHCGWWIARSEENLAEAMRQAVACTAEQLSSMGQNGRRLVEKSYSTKTVAQRFLEIYKEL